MSLFESTTKIYLYCDKLKIDTSKTYKKTQKTLIADKDAKLP